MIITFFLLRMSGIGNWKINGIYTKGQGPFKRRPIQAVELLKPFLRIILIIDFCFKNIFPRLLIMIRFDLN